MPLVKKQSIAQELTTGIVPVKTEIATSAQLAKVAEVKAEIKKTIAKVTSDTTMSKAEWHDKDVRISRQGLFQACLQSVGLLQLNTGNTLEDYLKLVEQAAERGLEFVNRR